MDLTALTGDLESSALYPDEMVWISQQLKERYGSAFAVTFAPAPWRSMDRTSAGALHRAGVLDLVSPQYYDLAGLYSELAKVDNAVRSLSAGLATAGRGQQARRRLPSRGKPADHDVVVHSGCATGSAATRSFLPGRPSRTLATVGPLHTVSLARYWGR